MAALDLIIASQIQSMGISTANIREVELYYDWESQTLIGAEDSGTPGSFTYRLPAEGFGVITSIAHTFMDSSETPFSDLSVITSEEESYTFFPFKNGIYRAEEIVTRGKFLATTSSDRLVVVKGAAKITPSPSLIAPLMDSNPPRMFVIKMLTVSPY